MAGGSERESRWADRILDMLEGIRYGTIQIVIHDGKIVQIERTEKFRFETPDACPEQCRKRPKV